MTRYILSIIVVFVLTNTCASAGEEEVGANLGTSYPTETSSELLTLRRLPHYNEITAEDQPDHFYGTHGPIKFEDELPGSPVKFVEDKQTKYDNGYAEPETDEALHGGNENSDENKSIDYEDEEEKVGSNDDERHLEYLDGKSNIPGRITFEDDSKKEGQQDVSKKRKTKRKPRVRPLPEGSHSLNHNAPHSGLGYPGYLNGGFPPGYPDYGDYPHVYSPSYTGYPVYPTPSPTSSYPDSQYPVSPPLNSKYSVRFPGHLGSYAGNNPYTTNTGAKDPRPQSNTVGFPGQNNQDQAAEAKPNDDYPGGRKPFPGGPYAGAGYSGYPAQTGYPGRPGYSNPGYRPHPGYQGYYGPIRRPKSLPERAISAVAEALTSIALFDDKQCVPRLLCEVASGSAGSSPTMLKATAGLEPLITVLQSYKGASSSPLFVFGRAAFLGVTTKGNPTSCRYAYPQCPNDPERLINYLNNHNGGFFRFFGKPENPNKQQNLEQFYNNLSVQYPQQQQSQSQQQPQNQQYGQQQQLNYGYPFGYNTQNSYGMPTYGSYNHREQNTFKNSKVIDSEGAQSNIEERIQNKPGIDALEEDILETGSRWTFPDEVTHKKREDKPKRGRQQKSKRPKDRPVIGEKPLKFPDDTGSIEDNFDIDREREYIRQQKFIFFPNNNHFNFQTKYQTTTPVNLDEYVFDYKHNFYVKRPKAVVNDDSETLYIVRGNGDPNHPEIVRVRPGQRA